MRSGSRGSSEDDGSPEQGRRRRSERLVGGTSERKQKSHTSFAYKLSCPSDNCQRLSAMYKRISQEERKLIVAVGVLESTRPGDPSAISSCAFQPSTSISPSNHGKRRRPKDQRGSVPHSSSCSPSARAGPSWTWKLNCLCLLPSRRSCLSAPLLPLVAYSVRGHPQRQGHSLSLTSASSFRKLTRSSVFLSSFRDRNRYALPLALRAQLVYQPRGFPLPQSNPSLTLSLFSSLRDLTDAL